MTPPVGTLSILAGLATAFLGRHFPRGLGFLAGFVAGYSTVFWIFSHNTNLNAHGLPVVFGLLGAFVGGIIALLVSTVSLSLVLTFSAGSMVIVMGSGMIFGGTISRLVLLCSIMLASLILGATRKDMLVLLSTTLTGSFLVVLGIDQFAGKPLAAASLRGTLLSSFYGTDGLHFAGCTPSCYILSAVWVLEACLGILFQVVDTRIDALHDLRIERKSRKGTISSDDRRSSVRSTHGHASHSYEWHALQAKMQPATPSAASAAFNYISDQDLSNDMRSIKAEIAPTFRHLGEQFGFQQGNIQNQQEHLIFLLGSIKSRNHTDCTTELHNKIFSNYREWCQFLRIRSRVTDKGATDDQALADKIEELCLWLLVWGEASSLRLMPECLCFIFHKMSRDNAAEDVRRRPGAYLEHVITPIWKIIRDAKGDIHTEKCNYDDLNEFFWSKDCLSYYYAHSDYRVRTSHDLSTPSSVADALKSSPKTYMERRTIAHAMLSFWRVQSFLLVGLHVMVCLAFVSRNQSTSIMHALLDKNGKIISSVVLTIAALSIIKELLCIVITFGSMQHNAGKTLALILRLMIKSIFFVWLALFYIWSWERNDSFWATYLMVSALFLFPHVFGMIGQVFPGTEAIFKNIKLPVVEGLLRFWNPLRSLYTGQNVHEPEQHVVKYQLFWITLLAWKFYCSYLFQIAPLVNPTLDLLFASHNLAHQRVSGGTHYFLVAVMWTPFILVYLFDIMIWSACWQTIAGLIVGLRDKIGEIREFPILVKAFPHAPAEFEKKMVNLSHDDDVESDSSEDEYENADEYHNPTWRRFALAWNQVVDDIRLGDLISDEEQHLLQFRFREDCQRDYYLPLFMTVGIVDHGLDTCAAKATRYAVTEGKSSRLQLERSLVKYFNHPFKKLGFAEIWELSTWLFSTLLGERHQMEMEICFEQLTILAGGPGVLENMNLKSPRSIKDTLLKLVRGLRICNMVFAREQKKLDAAANKKQSERRRSAFWRRESNPKCGQGGYFRYG